jgi:hypothetical protein
VEIIKKIEKQKVATYINIYFVNLTCKNQTPIYSEAGLGRFGLDRFNCIRLFLCGT